MVHREFSEFGAYVRSSSQPNGMGHGRDVTADAEVLRYLAGSLGNASGVAIR